MVANGFPTIWRNSVVDIAQWRSLGSLRNEWLVPARHIDHVVARSINARRFPAWCSVCASVQQMTLNWRTSAILQSGHTAPDWHRAVCCDECTLPSNVRAASQLLIDRGAAESGVRVEAASSVVVDRMGNRFPGITGSDFGTTETSDFVLSPDQLELADDWKDAVSRLRHLVAPDGSLILTCHFDASREMTAERPHNASDPEARRRIFGWDLVPALHSAGFGEVTAHLYWAPWQGHLGATSFVFEARR